ncbi:MAG: tetratricopeptide repeat protein, partial [Verrucomicrobiota bacterium]
LKPSNILVRDEGGKRIPTIIDFGIAKAMHVPLTEQTLATLQNQMIGTPAFMSPEQARMEEGAIDTRSDIYSLGVLLYELLTGCLPFDRKRLRTSSLAEVQRIICEEEPVFASVKFRQLAVAERARHADSRQTAVGRLGSRLKGDLDWIAFKALAKSPAKRYRTVGEFQDDLQRHLRHETVTAVGPYLGYRVRKYVRRHWVAATISGILLVAAIISAWQAMRATRSGQLAREEAALSKSVTEFLYHDLLAQADPAIGGQITLLEVLEKASRNIEKRFEDQPRVRSELHYILGRTYRSLEEYDTSLGHLEQAVALETERAGPTSRQVLTFRAERAHCHASAGNFALAETQTREVLADRTRILGRKDPDTVTSARNLGMVLRERGNHDEALRILQDALDVAAELWGPGAPDRLELWNELNLVHQHKRDLEEARDGLIEVLDLARAHLEPDHATIRRSLALLANVYSMQGEHGKAVPLLRDHLERVEEVFGPKHSQVARALHNLCWAYFQMDDFEKAEPLALRSLAISQKELGFDHPNTVEILGFAAIFSEWRGNHAKAEQQWVDCLEGQRRLFGEGHWRTLNTIQNLGEFYYNRGRFREAVDHYLTCIRRLPGEEKLLDSLETVVFMMGLKPLIEAGDSSTANYSFTIEDPGPDWAQVSFEGWRSWEVGASPFGKGIAFVKTAWSSPDLWLRAEFDLDPEEDAGPLVARILHDDSVEVFVNGVPAVARKKTSRGAYDTVPCSKEARAALRPGRNAVAVHVHNVGGSQQYADLGLYLDHKGGGAKMVELLTDLLRSESTDGRAAWLRKRAQFHARMGNEKALGADVREALQVDPAVDLSFLHETSIGASIAGVVAEEQQSLRDQLEDIKVDALWEPDRVIELMTRGSEWSFHDEGTDPGSDWREMVAFAGDWSRGRAPLGYGESDMVTSVRFGPDSSNRFPTTCFRRLFSCDEDPGSLKELKLRLRIDDGAVVYLNGSEILREGVAAGSGYGAFADRTIGGGDERTYRVHVVDAAALVKGTNLIAVEAFQADGTSSDLAFDLGIEAKRR